MTSKKILTKEMCLRFNNARKDLCSEERTFDKASLLGVLEEAFGIKVTDGLLTSLVNKKCIIRIKKGEYRFPEDPVYYGKLNEAYQQRNVLQNRNRVLSRNREFTVEEAIELLKKEGNYRVFRATINLRKALENKDKTVREVIEWIQL